MLTGDGNYAASSNGQCLLHLRSRHTSPAGATVAVAAASPAPPTPPCHPLPMATHLNQVKKTIGGGGRPSDDVVKRTRSLNV